MNEGCTALSKEVRRARCSRVQVEGSLLVSGASTECCCALGMGAIATSVRAAMARLGLPGFVLHLPSFGGLIHPGGKAEAASAAEAARGEARQMLAKRPLTLKLLLLPLHPPPKPLREGRQPPPRGPAKLTTPSQLRKEARQLPHKLRPRSMSHLALLSLLSSLCSSSLGMSQTLAQGAAAIIARTHQALIANHGRMALTHNS